MRYRLQNTASFEQLLTFAINYSQFYVLLHNYVA